MRVALAEQTIFVPVAFGSGRTVFDLLSGAARVRTGGLARSDPERLTVRTPQAQFGVKGPADFTLVVSNATYLSVSEGTVVATNAGGQAEFAAGTSAQVRDPGTRAASMTAAPAGVASTANALRGLDLERKAEEAAVAAAAEAKAKEELGPPPREQKFWAGGSVMLTRYDEGATAGLLSSGSLDQQSHGFRVFAGYQMFRNVGIEVGYADLGEVEYSGTFQGMAVTDGKLSITGFDVALVASALVSNRTALFGKVGAFMWEADASDRAGGVPFSTSTDGTNPMLGIGLMYSLSPTTAVRGEFESRRAADEQVNTFSLGLEVRF
jgi:hypothetical protein